MSFARIFESADVQRTVRGPINQLRDLSVLESWALVLKPGNCWVASCVDRGRTGNEVIVEAISMNKNSTFEERKKVIFYSQVRDISQLDVRYIALSQENIILDVDARVRCCDVQKQSTMPVVNQCVIDKIKLTKF